MEYRELGRTGLDVGAIGLGTEYLHGQPRETVTAVVAEAAERGVNYIDIIFSFSEYLDNLGTALAGRRDQVILALHLGCAETDGQYRRSRDVGECTRNFEDMLRRLRTDHADVIVVQNCDEQDDYDAIMGGRRLAGASGAAQAGGQGSLPGVQRPQRAGTDSGGDERAIRCADGVDQRAGREPVADETVPDVCREQAGLVAMKPFAGGGMLSSQSSATGPTPTQCLSYALSQPGVCAAAPGLKNVEELDAALHYFVASESERDYSALISDAGWNADGACTYCNHCTPCVQGIAIGQTMRLLDLSVHGVTADLRSQYLALPGAPASACIACGECRARCPFGVDTTERMKRAAATFEGQGRA